MRPLRTASWLCSHLAVDAASAPQSAGSGRRTRGRGAGGRIAGEGEDGGSERCRGGTTCGGDWTRGGGGGGRG
jgi:hypothetical protein